MFKLDFKKDRGTRDQIANIHWIIKKSKRIPEKHLLCFLDYAKAFDCVDPNKLWKILKEMGIPYHLTCLLRNLNAEFQIIARRDKKEFLRDQCKEIEENNRMGKTRDLFKKIRDTKGKFHAKMGSIKDKNCMDLTALLTMPKCLTMWITINCGKF